MSQRSRDAGAAAQTEENSITDTYLVTLNPDVDFNSHMTWVQGQMRQSSNNTYQCEVVDKYEIINGYQAKLSLLAYENISQCEQVKFVVKEQFAELDD
ncbi:hypothetical protein RSOLAG1IB_06752 [Rhizoctonia solani AG-1 IB]|uniref:Inhibitor I9 domain-containing protein n=1 Tax=Thanatephorus cucumeris (strain AG1-IB / isolate 7/3/14) TaxID=1108050 RepID=A0A0B7FCZ1_THACB|nr:hypothetical protein RSOLAG1IB_06752 [Rhizoctonia solani AG-1 IB]